jgi:hypothetical protein
MIRCIFLKLVPMAVCEVNLFDTIQKRCGGQAAGVVMPPNRHRINERLRKVHPICQFHKISFFLFNEQKIYFEPQRGFSPKIIPPGLIRAPGEVL